MRLIVVILFVFLLSGCSNPEVLSFQGPNNRSYYVDISQCRGMIDENDGSLQVIFCAPVGKSLDQASKAILQGVKDGYIK